MKIQFAALWSNPNTRYPAMIYLVCKVGLQIWEVWTQNYSQQIRATLSIIEGVVVTYGPAAGAGNATLKDTGDEIAARKAVEPPKAS